MKVLAFFALSAVATAAMAVQPPSTITLNDSTNYGLTTITLSPNGRFLLASQDGAANGEVYSYAIDPASGRLNSDMVCW